MADLPACVYCGTDTRTTADHVPPKSLFPKPRPSNLVTVVVCESCNQGAGKDEDFFLATFMFSSAGISPAGKRLWSEKLHRMYQKNSGLRRAIGRKLQHADLTTPFGLYLGRGMAIELDDTRIERVVSKVVRGLYAFEYGDTLAPDSTVHVMHIRSKITDSIAREHSHALRAGQRRWNGIFEYGCNRLADKPQGSIWLLRFYGCIVFMAATRWRDES